VRIWGGQAGRRLLLDRHVRVRHLPGPGWFLGDDVYLGVGAVLDVRRGATFRVGDRTKIMHHVVIGAAQSVTLGPDTQIAESSSVRDQDHDLAPGVVMSMAPVRTSPVVIGADVWIARGVAVLRGVTIADHAVVAANSVVRSDVPAHAIVGGAPARLLRSRLSDHGPASTGLPPASPAE